MHQRRRDHATIEAPIRRRKEWVRPTVTTLSAGSAELAGAGTDDGVDLS